MLKACQNAASFFHYFVPVCRYASAFIFNYVFRAKFEAFLYLKYNFLARL